MALKKAFQLWLSAHLLIWGFRILDKVAPNGVFGIVMLDLEQEVLDLHTRIHDHVSGEDHIKP